jgi:hypothetical protein
MNDVALIHLKYAVERHEDAPTEDVKQIKSLKDDLRELLNLMGLLRVFVQRRFLEWERRKPRSNSTRGCEQCLKNMESHGSSYEG